VYGCTLGKPSTGRAGGSLGLVAEAVHAGPDLVAALLTFFAVGFAVLANDVADRWMDHDSISAPPTLEQLAKDRSARSRDLTLTYTKPLSDRWTAQLDLTRDVTIQGSGLGDVSIVRSNAPGTPDFRIFQVQAGVSATLRGLTIYGGRVAGAGGGIWNGGTLALVNSVVFNNAALALWRRFPPAHARAPPTEKPGGRHPWPPTPARSCGRERGTWPTTAPGTAVGCPRPPPVAGGKSGGGAS